MKGFRRFEVLGLALPLFGEVWGSGRNHGFTLLQGVSTLATRRRLVSDYFILSRRYRQASHTGPHKPAEIQGCSTHKDSGFRGLGLGGLGLIGLRWS